jgi:hypothetical protein
MKSLGTFWKHKKNLFKKLLKTFLLLCLFFNKTAFVTILPFFIALCFTSSCLTTSTAFCAGDKRDSDSDTPWILRTSVFEKSSSLDVEFLLNLGDLLGSFLFISIFVHEYKPTFEKWIRSLHSYSPFLSSFLLDALNYPIISHSTWVRLLFCFIILIIFKLLS